jgi:hypothetical protein
VERSFADENELTAWGPLYRVGAGVALAMLALVPIAVLGFLVAPPPSTVSEAFALFQRSKLLGLVSLDLIYMMEIILGGLLLLVLCVALRRVSPSFVAVALFLNIVATSIYFASNPAFEMLTLAGRHAVATTDVERTMFLAAGEGMLATYEGTAYNVSYVIAGLASLIVALVMLRSGLFGRATAYVGVVMGALALVPPTVGTVGFIAAFAYLAPLLIWLVLVAWALLRLVGPPGRKTAEAAAPPELARHLAPRQ